jgi:hypothetical protein
MSLGIASRYEHLYPYWRERLKNWIKEVYGFRHARYTSGWSSATQGFFFAELLHRECQISESEFQRYARLDKRVQRWERFDSQNVEGTPCQPSGSDQHDSVNGIE